MNFVVLRLVLLAWLVVWLLGFGITCWVWIVLGFFAFVGWFDCLFWVGLLVFNCLTGLL